MQALPICLMTYLNVSAILNIDILNRGTEAKPSWELLLYLTEIKPELDKLPLSPSRIWIFTKSHCNRAIPSWSKIKSRSLAQQSGSTWIWLKKIYCCREAKQLCLRWECLKRVKTKHCFLTISFQVMTSTWTTSLFAHKRCCVIHLQSQRAYIFAFITTFRITLYPWNSAIPPHWLYYNWPKIQVSECHMKHSGEQNMTGLYLPKTQNSTPRVPPHSQIISFTKLSSVILDSQKSAPTKGSHSNTLEVILSPSLNNSFTSSTSRFTGMLLSPLSPHKITSVICNQVTAAVTHDAKKANILSGSLHLIFTTAICFAGTKLWGRGQRALQIQDCHCYLPTLLMLATPSHQVTTFKKAQPKASPTRQEASAWPQCAARTAAGFILIYCPTPGAGLRSRRAADRRDRVRSQTFSHLFYWQLQPAPFQLSHGGALSHHAWCLGCHAIALSHYEPPPLLSQVLCKVPSWHLLLMLLTPSYAAEIAAPALHHNAYCQIYPN